MNVKLVWTSLMTAVLTVGCASFGKDNPGENQGVEEFVFGQTPDGQPVAAFTITNINGLEATILEYGAIMQSLLVPDRDGNLADIVLGMDSIPGYATESPYFGAIAGRYANRIANGKFSLDGQDYTLATNNAPHHLHGGVVGFDKVLWDGEAFETEDSVGVKLKYRSADMEEGYPGNLTVTMSYTLTDDDILKFEYWAETDKPTVVNLTQHNYYNLLGHNAGSVKSQFLQINANQYTVPDATLIPTGEIAAVEGTPLDFTQPSQIGARLHAVEGGYDHNYVLNGDKEGLNLAARVYEATTGRIMTIYTTEPGLQFYSGNFLDGTITMGKEGAKYAQHGGFCLETQRYPDTPNQPSFPSAVLRPGETYHHLTTHHFTVMEVESPADPS